LAADREPQRVLSYEIDRLTPFAGEGVFWGWQVVRRDRTHGRLHLRLSLVPKRSLRPFLAFLANAGITPGAIEFAMQDGAIRRIAMTRPDARAAYRQRRALAAGGIICFVLALAAIAMPFVLQEIASRRLDSRIEALRPQVARVEALRRRISAAAAGQDAMAAEQMRTGNALAVLAALTETLPDDTHLTDLTLRQGKLELNGRSAAAARLIGLLAGDPRVLNPSFTAPVTRTPDGRTDLFSIRAEVSQ
jgi:general secretion pathway protein L